MKTIDISRDTDGPVHAYFGLSYANNDVVPRSLAQSMPADWQHRYVAVMEELRAAFAHIDLPGGYEVTAGTWMHPDECSPAELAAAGARAYWVDENGETIPEQAIEDCPDWSILDNATARWEWRDDEVDSTSYVFVPSPDPVPHYNRGRTYVEPRPPESAADRIHFVVAAAMDEYRQAIRSDTALSPTELMALYAAAVLSAAVGGNPPDYVIPVGVLTAMANDLKASVTP